MGMGTETDKPLRGLRRLLGWALLAATMAVAILFGFLLTRGLRPPAVAPSGSDVPAAAITALLVLLGGLLLGSGGTAYVLVLLTDCFTLSVVRPVWKTGFTTRLWLANVVVPLLLLAGLGTLSAAVLRGLLTRLGLAAPLNLAVPFFLILIPGQFLLAWFNLWAPIEKSLIRRRLAAQGLSAAQLDYGLYVGVSDPRTSSLRKFGLVEDDVGMLWLTPRSLVYRGDAQSWEIPRDALVDLRRAVDKGSIAAYAGAVHIILRWRAADGSEQCARLHAENCWSLSVVARALDRLWDRLEAWRLPPPALAPIVVADTAPRTQAGTG